MPDLGAVVSSSGRSGGMIARRIANPIRRAAHRLLCLVPMYRQRAARIEADRFEAPASVVRVKAVNVAASIPTARRIDLSDRDAVHRLLGDIKTRGLHATAGKIQLVHLDSIRRKFGARWSSVSARAMDLAERVVRDRLDETDIFTRYENFAFVVVFSMIDDAVAQSKAEAISSRIHDLLMTDPELAEVFDVKTATARIDALAEGEPAPSPEALGEKLDTGPAGRETAPIRGASKLLGTLSLGYQPIFRVSDRSIAISVALPERKTPEGEVLYGERAYPEGAGDVRTEELDRLLTDHVINDLLLPVNAGKQRIVATVMSFHSLTKSARLVYRLGQLPESVRPRFAVEVIGLSADSSVDALTGAIRKLANVSAYVALRADFFDGVLERFADCGLHSIGCDLSHPDVAALPPGERDPAIHDFVKRAKSAAKCAHIYGISTTGALKTAIAAGADYLSGDAIGPCTSKPKPVRSAGF